MLVREGSILLCHRTATREWFPDVWDLAGGHIESGESPAQAVVRECFEELGIAVAEPGDALDGWRDDDLELTVFRIVDWHGEVTNVAPEEHDRLAWFTPRPLWVSSSPTSATDDSSPPSLNRPAPARARTR